MNLQCESKYIRNEGRLKATSLYLFPMSISISNHSTFTRKILTIEMLYSHIVVKIMLYNKITILIDNNTIYHVNLLLKSRLF